eukprot:8258523-Alexandrium_andersonii.AAC.1
MLVSERETSPEHMFKLDLDAKRAPPPLLSWQRNTTPSGSVPAVRWVCGPSRSTDCQQHRGPPSARTGGPTAERKT